MQKVHIHAQLAATPAAAHTRSAAACWKQDQRVEDKIGPHPCTPDPDSCCSFAGVAGMNVEYSSAAAGRSYAEGMILDRVTAFEDGCPSSRPRKIRTTCLNRS